MSVPQTRLPAHSPSLSQSPPPRSQGCKAVQHAHVSVVVQSQAVVSDVVVGDAVIVDDVTPVEIVDAFELKQVKNIGSKRSCIYYKW